MSAAILPLEMLFFCVSCSICQAMTSLMALARFPSSQPSPASYSIGYFPGPGIPTG
jgi:hypothetical protein